MNPYAPLIPSPPTQHPAGAAVPVPGLEGRVFVRQRSLFEGPGFIVDGTLRRSARGFVEIPDTMGRIHRLRVRGFPFDPCPRVEADGVMLDVFPRLPTWVSALCSLPLLLVFTSGAIGGLVGAFAMYGTFRVARSRLPTFGRIVLGAIVTAAAYGLAVGIGLLIRSLVR